MKARSGLLETILVVLVFCMPTLHADDVGLKKDVEDDAKLIQGTWTVVELQQVNHPPSKEEKEFFKSGGFKITITADKLVFSPDKSEVKYRLDLTKKPKVMELLKDEKVVALAIYDLKGDDLKICQGRKSIFGEEPEPPTDFDILKAKEGTFPTLFVMKRNAKEQDRK